MFALGIYITSGFKSKRKQHKQFKATKVIFESGYTFFQCILVLMFKDVSYIIIFKGRRGVAHWLARNVSVVGSSPIRGPRCFLEQETYCLVPVGSRNGFERDFTIELK